MTRLSAVLVPIARFMLTISVVVVATAALCPAGHTSPCEVTRSEGERRQYSKTSNISGGLGATGGAYAKG